MIDYKMAAIEQKLYDLQLQDQDRPSELSVSALELWQSCHETNSKEELDRAIAIQRSAFKALRPSDPRRTAFVEDLALMIGFKSNFISNPKEWNHIIDIFQKVESSNASVVDGSILFLNTMSEVVYNGYNSTKNRDFLEQALRVGKKAILAAGDGPSPLKTIALKNRSEQILDEAYTKENFDEAVKCARLSVEAANTDPSSLDMSKTRLCQLIGNESSGFCDVSDIEESVLLARAVTQILPDSNSNKPLRLNMLATQLASLYLNSTNPEIKWLDEANSLMDKALELIPRDSEDRGVMYLTLCIINFRRYKESNSEVDIDKSIHYGRQAVEALPAEDHQLPFCLTRFSESLGLKFENKDFGSLADLDEALIFSRKALSLTSPRDLRFNDALNKLCYMLERRAEVTGNIDTLEEAIQTRRCRDYTIQSGATNLIGLTDLLCTQFRWTRKPQHLGIMIHVGRQLYLEAKSLSRFSVLEALASRAYERCSEAYNPLPLYENAICLYLAILKEIGEGHPEKSIGHLVTLTELADSRWKLTGDSVDGFYADDIEVWNCRVSLMLQSNVEYLDPANSSVYYRSRVTGEEISLGPGERDSRNERKGPPPYIPSIEENKASFAKMAADAIQQENNRAKENGSQSPDQATIENSEPTTVAENLILEKDIAGSDFNK